MKCLLFVFTFVLILSKIVCVKYEEEIENYVKNINDFIKSTETYTYPTDSREFLKAQNENILNECVHAGEYDFIIIGSGSSGCVLASRLSEVPTWRILLLEAGGDALRISEIPAMAEYLPFSNMNWGYWTTPQKESLQAFINNSSPVFLGKSLGGTSSLNNLFYTRGHREDFNLWNSLGNPGWSYRDLLPYFHKSERVDIFNPNPGYHGKHGEINVEGVDILSPLTYAFLLANKELKREENDYNGIEEKVFSTLQMMTKNGKRENAKLFLKNRHNLKILTNAFVVKLLSRNNTIYGVQYIQNGGSYCIEATMEIILSAGPINTPHLLMLSGIGPKKHLSKHNITSIQNLEGVGENMWNHISYNFQTFINNYTLKDISLKKAVKYYLDGKGYLTVPNFYQNIGYVSLFGRKRPDVEHIFRASKMSDKSYNFYRKYGFGQDFYDYIIKPLTNLSIWNIDTVLLHPKSRGNVKLKSKSPFDFPLIDPNYFNSNIDIQTLTQALKDIIKISQTYNMQLYNSSLFKIALPACSKYNYYSKAYYTCVIKNLASPIGDFSGTCKMGPMNDNFAVVDNELKVYGIKKLRIVDSSVIPVTVSGHINALAYVIGEKAADLIKKQYGELDSDFEKR